jgi:hypothetical protein
MKLEGPWSLPAACLVAGLVLFAPVSWAQRTISSPPAIYSCTDADGRVISSDRPIAACSQRPMRELNADGSVRRIIAPPMTKEQQREQAALQKERQDEAWARKVQQSRDRNLLLTFEDERSLESMRRRGLADIDHEIRLATQRILSMDKELKIAQEAAAPWQEENPRKALPFHFQQRITDAANAILAEDALIADRNIERDRVNSRFDADARRLRELLGKPAHSQDLARSPRS